MYKKILVGIDGSENSMRAAIKAAKMGKISSGKIIVYHSVKHRLPPRKIPLLFPFNIGSESPTYDIPEPDYVDIQEQYEEAGKQVLKKALKKLKAEAGDDINVEAKLVLDIDPAGYAVDQTTNGDVDLVVVGCQGHHSKLREIFLGTVAEKILNRVDSDVLVVR